MTTRTALAFGTLALIWGSGFTLIKIALTGLSPGQVVLTRLTLGAIALTVAVRMRGGKLPRDPRLWLHLTVAGVLGSVAPYLLLSYGEQEVSAGVAGTLVGATPLLALALTAALRAEQISTARTIGVSVGFAGVVVVVTPWQATTSSLLGLLLCLGAAACYATAFLHVRYALSNSGLDTLTLAAGQLSAAAIVQAALTPAIGWSTPHLTVGILAAVATLGVLGTGLAYLLYVHLTARLGATGAASVDYLVPVVAVAVGVVALGEPLTWTLIGGGLIVLVGIAVAQLPASRPRRSITGPGPVTPACPVGSS